MSHDILLIGEAPSQVLMALHGQGHEVQAIGDTAQAGRELEAGVAPDLVLLACPGDPRDEAEESRRSARCARTCRSWR